MLSGFKSMNHPQQIASRGAVDEVDDRGTDPAYVRSLEKRFGQPFTLDVAAAAHNTKAARYFTRADDGLAQSWAGERVWCNPPYSDLYSWVEKAWAEYEQTRGIVMLLPANRPEQKWWQQLVEPRRDRPGSPLHVEFLPGRMRFERRDKTIGPKGDRPPFGCCLLIWEAAVSLPASPGKLETAQDHGKVAQQVYAGLIDRGFDFEDEDVTYIADKIGGVDTKL